MGFQTLSKCKANVDINVNVVVYFDRLFCIATREVNIDRAAGGLRYAAFLALHQIKLKTPINAYKRRPRARNAGRRSIAVGVFNPPPCA